METNKSKMKRISVTINHAGQIIEKNERNPKKNANENIGHDLGGTPTTDK